MTASTTDKSDTSGAGGMNARPLNDTIAETGPGLPDEARAPGETGPGEIKDDPELAAKLKAEVARRRGEQA